MRSAWKLVTFIARALTIGIGLVLAYILLLAVRDWLRRTHQPAPASSPLLGDRRPMGSQPAFPVVKPPPSLPLDTATQTGEPRPERTSAHPEAPPPPTPSPPPPHKEPAEDNVMTEDAAADDETAEAGEATAPAEPLPAEPMFEGNEVVPPHWPCKEGQIKANRDSKKYHVPAGRFYARFYEGVECFDTEEEASAAGYTRSKR